MSTDPDLIREQIEQTRRDLSSNVDALTDKVDPRRIAGDRVGQARGAFTRVKEKVMGSQMDGHGAAQRMTGSMQQMSGQAGQKMSSAADSMQHMTGQAGQKMSSAADSMQHMTGQAGQRMSNAAGSVRDEARSMGQQSRQQLQGNPLAAGLIAFGAGLLASALIPPSRRERQWTGQAKDMVGHQLSEHSGQLREQASHVGHEFRENMQGPAQEAARSVGSTAIKGASQMREQGRSAAQHVRGQTHEAAGELRR
ncbi:DUF3618 domain-containing protein [Micromonospora costi]|uniref:DUF3618 domain-containing protein n=1 Tax=Micromonospora costi TaxID=1530042 RepID=A0A3B0A266_9ACTN|nr:DUF3618 domain-containing protein [Micromonospora costi]RKN54414.1 DUF3618 domain-containing protein [Micromonospora costi]